MVSALTAARTGMAINQGNMRPPPLTTAARATVGTACLLIQRPARTARSTQGATLALRPPAPRGRRPPHDRSQTPALRQPPQELAPTTISWRPRRPAPKLRA